MPSRRKTAPRSAEYLNVDLVLESRRKLDPLLAVLGERVIVLHHERRDGFDHAVLELSAQQNSPNAAIRAFVRILERLSAKERVIWNSARIREFDIGIDVGGRREAPVVSVSRETVAAASRVRASIAVTCYPATSPTPQRPTQIRRIE